MERLTFDGLFCDIAKCDSTQGGTFCESGTCTIRRVWERLKEYEDTGLEPEDLKKAFNETAILKLAAQALSTTPDHIRDLIQAEQDGRLVVLPCKVGADIYRVGAKEVCSYWQIERAEIYQDEIVLVDDSDNVIFHEDLGKTVFLTREEAEAALAQKEAQ